MSEESVRLGIHVCTAQDVGQVVVRRTQHREPYQCSVISCNVERLCTMNVCIRVPESLCCPPDTKANPGNKLSSNSVLKRKMTPPPFSTPPSLPELFALSAFYLLL